MTPQSTYALDCEQGHLDLTSSRLKDGMLYKCWWCGKHWFVKDDAQ